MNPVHATLVLLMIPLVAAAQVPTTSPATSADSELAGLVAEIKMLRSALEQRDKELVSLRQEIRSLKARLGGDSSPTTLPAARASVKPAEKRITVPAREGLPDKSFTHMAVGQIGHIYGFTVLRVMDHETALVTIEQTSGYQPDPRVPIPVFTNTFILEGVPTDGMADRQLFNINLFIKVVETRKVDNQTRFVVWPVVKADWKSLSPPPPPQRRR